MQQPEKVVVPALVGLTLTDAYRLAGSAGVTLDLITGPAREGVVTGQDPLAGRQVDHGAAVQVSVDESGGGGGGSPLVPPPTPSDPSGAKDPATV